MGIVCFKMASEAQFQFGLWLFKALFNVSGDIFVSIFVAKRNQIDVYWLYFSDSLDLWSLFADVKWHNDD